MRRTRLEQAPDEWDLWHLHGVGTFLRTGRVSRAATAEAGGRRWELRRVGLVRPGFTATDEAGTVVGRVQQPLFGRSDALVWAGRELQLALVEVAPRRWGRVLRDGDRTVAVLVPDKRGKRPHEVELGEPLDDAGLLLFAGFISQALEDDASFPEPDGV